MVKRLLPAVVAVAFLLSCSDDRPGPPGPRPRIITFSPALTQTVFDMGLGEHVVGVTRVCILPVGQERPALGDAFNVNSEAILVVRPDVLLVQTADLRRFEGIRQIDPAVRIERFTIETIADVRLAIARIGRVVGREDLARQALSRFDDGLQAVSRRVAGRPRPRVVFVMGTRQPAVAGADNFVHDLVELAGGANVGAEIPGQARWRKTGIETILAVRPDVLICQVFSLDAVASAREYWMGWNDLPAAGDRRVFVVSDRAWSIPSTGLADLAPRLADMIHPETSSAGGRP